MGTHSRDSCAPGSLGGGSVCDWIGEVTDIDARARRLSVLGPDGETRSVDYDSLILAGGVTTSYFGNDRFEQWAPGMKTIDDALRLRGRIFGAFEMAEWETDDARRAAWRSAPRFHFHSGVASASSSVEPRTSAEEPRKRRRGKFICRQSLRRISERNAARFPSLLSRR